MINNKKTALFSLTNFYKLDYFAENLIKNNWQIIATKETYNFLKQKGINVILLDNFIHYNNKYDFPPSLHPDIEFLITNKDNDNCIDLVYVIPYKKGLDIGARTLLSLAIKGSKITINNVFDMEKFIDNKINELDFKNNVLIEICNFYEKLFSNDFLLLKFKHNFNLLYGENPYQRNASFYENLEDNDPLSLKQFKLVSGKLPCYTNFVDMDSILNTLVLIYNAFLKNLKKTPYICICAKHGNVCGLGISFNSKQEAITNALFGDPLSVWGGEVIVNFKIDECEARILFESNDREKKFNSRYWMLDVICGPKFSNKAIEILGQRKARKLYENINLKSPFLPLQNYTFRYVRGGIVKQDLANFILDISSCKYNFEYNEQTLIDIIIAWSVAYSSNFGGNEVAIAKNNALIACGGGSSTLLACENVINKAIKNGKNVKKSVFVADAFFPFEDAPKILIKNGIYAGAVVEGGKNEDKIKSLFKQNNINIFYIKKEYRGFCKH